MGLRSFLQKIFISRWLFSVETPKESKSLPSKIESVGFILTLQKPEDEKNFREVEKIILAFFTEAKEVKSIGLVNAKKQKNIVYKNPDLLFKNEIDWWGHIKSFAVKKFIKQPFDILFNLSNQDLPVLQVILSQSQAKFKVGSGAKKTLPFHDFIVNPKVKGDPVELTKALIDYLKIVKS